MLEYAQSQVAILKSLDSSPKEIHGGSHLYFNLYQSGFKGEPLRELIDTQAGRQMHRQMDRWADRLIARI